MNLRTEKYDRTSLKEFISSDQFKELDELPISYERALSHINNPRVSDDDIILVTLHDDDVLVAYRTVMADYVFNGSNKVKVGWISGSWTNPKYRRKGYGTQLFNELNELWSGRLMYTNYAPASKKLYDKTAVFETYQTKNGMRFYIKSDLNDLVPKRYPKLAFLSYMFMLMDESFNMLVLPFMRKVDERNPDVFWVRKARLEADQVYMLVDNTLTSRRDVEFKWISKFPWVITSASRSLSENGSYFFSWKAERFDQYFIEGTMADDTCIAMISIKNQQMKVPYASYDDKTIKILAEKILNEAGEMDVSYVDIFDEDLVNCMKDMKNKYVISKAQERKYMVSKSVIGEFPKASYIRIPDGEGDVVFV